MWRALIEGLFVATLDDLRLKYATGGDWRRTLILDSALAEKNIFVIGLEERQ
jgi:hypothetical protein